MQAKNGVCEEGRLKPGTTLDERVSRIAYCDLGTDCADCGPWRSTVRHVPWEDVNAPGPIRFLRSKDVQIRVKPAAVPRDASFLFAFTTPAKDFGVSHQLEYFGLLEPALTQAMYLELKAACAGAGAGGARRPLVVDVGANFGWFAILAARLGCRVTAYEPVLHYRLLLLYNIHLNDLSSRITISDKAVSDKAGKVSIVFPYSGHWGSAGIEGINIDKGADAATGVEDALAVRLEDEVNEDVLLLKLSVEGYEAAALEGAERLFRTGSVKHLALAYTPGAAERWNKFDMMLRSPQALASMLQAHGFRAGLLPALEQDAFKGFDQPLPPLQEVTVTNLQYDAEDVRRWKNGTLGCPLPAALQKLPAWEQCFSNPESFSPRSLRSVMGHSGRLWLYSAGAAPANLTLEGAAGIVDPAAPAETYYATNKQGLGMGGRPCTTTDPKAQVRHRCRCTDTAVCGAEADAVEAAAREGSLPQNYVLSPGNSKKPLDGLEAAASMLA
ncbi:hypothetical protein HYH03_004400 [Edaphochlamys debaryana]|uniref:Methyltransferase FkbM domain-containing protein n=1 Tax=Edaphochlamys debaryana TaxID=47281 RepID=A0A835YB99_9CHLO|nr:hypothetical protein HYH03_004400 [Edaphochlamys debaryana]|eukprot:KAG2497661.1 hypothetical protein HYH03_004400 [Edaphochlamys debaryana]